MKSFHILFALLFSVTFYAQQTESPYLKVLTKNAQIPLKETSVDVQITGTIAHVKILQVYKNDGSTPIEAKYIFPLSTQAAIHKMDMSIGNRTIHAKIFEKKQAQKVYNKAIKEGKRAAKLDQERPNVFQMNVGNVMPNDEIKIEIYFTEMLVPVDGEYKFVFPTVVGPRFVGETAKSEKVFNTPYTKKGVNTAFDFNLSVCINAGIMLQSVTSKTHKIDITYPSSESAEIFLSDENKNPSNRDFILKYSLRGNKIQSGLLLYKGKKENFFTFMMEPSARIVESQIPPREYIFILDVSGSMTGYPLDVSKKLLQNLIGNLRNTDSFNILLFAGGSTIFKEKSVVANPENIGKAIKFLSGNFGGGSTYLLDALLNAYSIPRTDKNNSRSMVVITDGYVNVEKEVFQLIKSNLHNANVFAFGIGSSVNRYIIEGMSKVSNTESFIATNETEAYEIAKKFKKYIEFPLLTQINFKTEGFDVYDITPTSISDILASRPLMIYGKWRGEPTGKIIITGKQGSGDFKKEYNVVNGNLSKTNKALKYLWARKKIELFDDLNFNSEDFKQQVIDLSLEYNLLTKYTSFVAVDDEVVNKKGNSKTVKQPLPLPFNIENVAVGASAEINESFVAKPQYILEFSVEKEISKTEERKFKIWFKANYSDVVSYYLKHKESLKIYFNQDGELDMVEEMYDGKWQVNMTITTEFLKQTSHKFSGNSKSMSITVHTPLKAQSSIVFITGTDEGANSYFTNAREYFKNKKAVIVENVTSLNGIITWLNSNYDRQIYKEIHIVSHSNSWRGMSLKNTISGERITEASLKKSISKNEILNLKDILSKDTKIIFHACGLGENIKLIQSLKTVFTTDVSPKLYASKLFSVFGANESKHYLAEVYYGYYPTANSPGKVDLSKEFKKEYPKIDIKWLDALYKKTEGQIGESFSYKFNIPVTWNIEFLDLEDIPKFRTKDDLLDFISENEKMASELFRLKIPIEKFRWSSKSKNNMLYIKGKVTVVCVLKPKMDIRDNTEYAILDINNTSLYVKI
ncbi:MAG: VIT domain-containing protein [Flavobacteriaceae bacterium]